MNIIKKYSKKLILIFILTFTFLTSSFVLDTISIFDTFTNGEITVSAKSKSSSSRSKSYKSSSFKSSGGKSSVKKSTSGSGGYKSSSFSETPKGKESSSKGFKSGSFSTSKDASKDKVTDKDKQQDDKDISYKNSTSYNSGGSPRFSSRGFGRSSMRVLGYNIGFSFSSILLLLVIFIVIVIIIKIYLSKRKY